MKVSQKQLRKMILREMRVLLERRSLGDRASVDNGNIVISDRWGEESWTYALSATKGFMKNVPVRIVSIASSGDTLRVSGKALKPDGSVLMAVENDIPPTQVAEIESNLGKGNFSVQGKKALINFSKVV